MTALRSQTYINKLRIAPRFEAPAMLHTFALRPAAAAAAALRARVVCAHWPSGFIQASLASLAR